MGTSSQDRRATPTIDLRAVRRHARLKVSFGLNTQTLWATIGSITAYYTTSHLLQCPPLSPMPVPHLAWTSAILITPKGNAYGRRYSRCHRLPYDLLLSNTPIRSSPLDFSVHQGFDSAVSNRKILPCQLIELDHCRWGWRFPRNISTAIKDGVLETAEWTPLFSSRLNLVKLGLQMFCKNAKVSHRNSIVPSNSTQTARSWLTGEQGNAISQYMQYISHIIPCLFL